jgi:hypothetical protein
MARRPTAGLYQDQAGAACRSAGSCPRFAVGAIDAFDPAKEYIGVKPDQARYNRQAAEARSISCYGCTGSLRSNLLTFEMPPQASDSIRTPRQRR